MAINNELLPKDEARPVEWWVKDETSVTTSSSNNSASNSNTNNPILVDVPVATNSGGSGTAISSAIKDSIGLITQLGTTDPVLNSAVVPKETIDNAKGDSKLSCEEKIKAEMTTMRFPSQCAANQYYEMELAKCKNTPIPSMVPCPDLEIQTKPIEIPNPFINPLPNPSPSPTPLGSGSGSGSSNEVVSEPAKNEEDKKVNIKKFPYWIIPVGIGIVYFATLKK